MNNLKCPRCQNEDITYFYRGSKGWYCRRCISFSRILLEEDLEITPDPIRPDCDEYLLKYPLTKRQKEIAGACAERVFYSDVLVHAVCGAGKTEITVLAIAAMLKRGKRVCFAIARRQVVLELADRLKEIFPEAHVVAVCGGHTQEIDGDIIVATTHQLYRYPHWFDLLILDEPDAFPYRGNETLHGIASTCCRGHRLFLTATPDEELKRMVEDGKVICYELNRRPHGHPLPEPVVRYGPSVIRFMLLLRWLKKHNGPRLVFAPTIRIARILWRSLSLFMDCYLCTSKTENRDEIITDYRRKKDGVMVATTVLERGVTIPGVDVCIWSGEHRVFDEAGLVQMAGRAGRTFEKPDGDVLFLNRARSETVDRCVEEIRRANACAV